MLNGLALGTTQTDQSSMLFCNEGRLPGKCDLLLASAFVLVNAAQLIYVTASALSPRDQQSVMPPSHRVSFSVSAKKKRMRNWEEWKSGGNNECKSYSYKAALRRAATFASEDFLGDVHQMARSLIPSGRGERQRIVSFWRMILEKGNSRLCKLCH